MSTTETGGLIALDFSCRGCGAKIVAPPILPPGFRCAFCGTKPGAGEDE